MNFVELTKLELEAFQRTNKHRYLYQQDSYILDSATKKGLKTKILALKDGNDILIYSVFIYYRYKKIFRRAISSYGPIILTEDIEAIALYFQELDRFFKKDFSIIYVRMNPFINEIYFKDIHPLKENETAKTVGKILENQHFISLKDVDLFTDYSLPSKCIYVKDMTGITEETLLKTLTPKAKQSINKTINDGIKVRKGSLFNQEDEKIFQRLLEKTSTRLGVNLYDVDFYKNLESVFKEKAILVFSYLDVAEFKNHTNQRMIQLNMDKQDLIKKLEVQPSKEDKIKKELVQIENVLKSLENRLTKIADLTDDILYLTVYFYVELKMDLIYVMGLTDKFYNAFEGPNAITYHMLKYAIDRKIKYYNFLGTSYHFTKDAVDYNVLQFKRSFNGDIECLMSSYEKKYGIGKLIKFV